MNKWLFRILLAVVVLLIASYIFAHVSVSAEKRQAQELIKNNYAACVEEDIEYESVFVFQEGFNKTDAINRCEVVDGCLSMEICAPCNRFINVNADSGTYLSSFKAETKRTTLTEYKEFFLKPWHACIDMCLRPHCIIPNE